MITIIPRDVWAELPPARPMTKTDVGRNIEGWICHWPGPYVSASQTTELNSYNRYHQQTKGWAFLAYNFAVGGDGTIYEGRGWDHRNAANSGANSTTYSVLFLGTGKRKTGTEVSPTSAALFAAGRLVAVHRGDGQIRPHSAVTSTTCPGDLVRMAIPTIRRVADDAVPPVPEPVPVPLPGPANPLELPLIAEISAGYLSGRRSAPNPDELKYWVNWFRTVPDDQPNRTPEDRLTDLTLWIAYETSKDV